MKLDQGTLLYSLSDLLAAADCEFAVLRRVDELLGWVAPLAVEPDALAERASRLGDLHEASILRRYRDRFGSGVVEIARPYPYLAANLETARSQTLAALAANVPIVYQAAIIDGRLTGFADFIALTEQGEYEVADAKLARRAKVNALLQVAAYADVLAGQGVPISGTGRLLLGDGSESAHPLGPAIEVYRDRRRRFQNTIDAHRHSGVPVEWDDDRIGRCGSRDTCVVCAAYIADSRDLRRVAGMRMSQRAKLRAAGIKTIDDLAGSTASRPAAMASATFGKLQGQAQLQVRGDQSGEPLVETLADHRLDTIPPPDPGDIFFDFEGDPLWQDPTTGSWGLEYLFGVVEVPGDPGADPVYRSFWAHDRQQERQALIDFLSSVRRRRAKYPKLHIYHYANYERDALVRLAATHGVGEEDVDNLLRENVLVDLFTVVRGSIRVSQDSYGLKSIEPLYLGGRHREGEVKSAAASVVEYAEYCAQLGCEQFDAAATKLSEIADYNRDDCVSTLRLRDWLRSLARDAAADSAAVHDELDVSQLPVVEPPNPLAETLREAAGQPAARTSDQTALALVGAAVEYHRREAKPYWWGHYERARNPVSQWEETRDAVTLESVVVTSDWAKPAGKPRSNPRRTVEAIGFIAPGSDLERDSSCQVAYSSPFPDGIEAATGFEIALTTGESLERLDGDTDSDDVGAGAARDGNSPASAAVPSRARLRVTEVLPTNVKPHAHLPTALVIKLPPNPRPLRDAIAKIAQRVCDVLPSGPVPGLSAAAAAIGSAANVLRRQPPSVIDDDPLPAVVDGDYADAITRAVLRLDRSTLAVQGPPGTGKTFTAAHVIKRLVREHGWRVGVVSQSHATTENLLHALVAAGVDPQLVGKPGNGDTDPRRPWHVIPKNDAAGGFLDRGGRVLGGTAWTFCAKGIAPGMLDLLVIDEAGQFSLANTLAVSLAAQRLLLLGDPQQLPQVSQGTHYEPVDESAIGWISQGHTLPPEFGYFLERSWRMHPKVTAVVSKLAYEGRLRSHSERTTARELSSADGTAIDPGVRAIEVKHMGCSVESEAEARRVVELVLDALTWQWRDETEAAGRSLTPADVLVVAPFNAQVALIKRRLAAAGLGAVAVGTVDKYQGREAPIVIVSMTTSDPREVPRGMDFVLNTNRLNVAISRAKWLAFVVHSPALTDYLPSKPDGLVELGSFLRVITGAD